MLTKANLLGCKLLGVLFLPQNLFQIEYPRLPWLGPLHFYSVKKKTDKTWARGTPDMAPDLKKALVLSLGPKSQET